MGFFASEEMSENEIKNFEILYKTKSSATPIYHSMKGKMRDKINIKMDRIMF